MSGVGHGLPVDVIHFDFTKASHKMQRRSLLANLDQFDVCDELLSCIDSLLSGRSFRNEFGSSFSSTRHSLNGVPQGSV